MQEVVIYMRNGKQIKFECEEIIKVVNTKGKIIEIEVEHGGSREKLFHVDIEQVDGIIVNERWEDND